MSEAAGSRQGHIYEVDVVRVVTFAAVVAVHTVSTVNQGGTAAPNAVLMLLHFTRSAFFAITGFVLIHQYLARPLAVRGFWRRRLLLVGVPYVVWSLLYVGLHQFDVAGGSVSGYLREIGPALLLGQAWYHLYFLLVSMQIYVVFPWIRWLVRRTAGHHRALLGVSVVVQVASLVWLRYLAPTGGLVGKVLGHADALLPTYQFYVLLGAVAACHLPAARAWVLAHCRAVALGVIAAAALTEGWFVIEIVQGNSATRAARVLQPGMLPWSVLATVGLFALGAWWARGPALHAGQARLLRTASDRSFGVFLMHPAVLWVVLRVDGGWLTRTLPALPATLVAYVSVLAVSVGLTEIARRGPLSLPITGRPRLGARRTELMPAAQSAPQSPAFTERTSP